MLSARSSESPALWPLRCDASTLPADASVIDGLARVALVARRHGCELSLMAPGAELRELIAFMGLADVLRCED